MRMFINGLSDLVEINWWDSIWLNEFIEFLNLDEFIKPYSFNSFDF